MTAENNSASSDDKTPLNRNYKRYMCINNQMSMCQLSVQMYSGGADNKTSIAERTGS